VGGCLLEPTVPTLGLALQGQDVNFELGHVCIEVRHDHSSSDRVEGAL